MWHITNQKFRGSALGLQRVLGFGSYQTAWAWLHKIRRAIIRSGRERLSGLVEVDETYVGGLEAGACGRHAEKKAIVVIAVEIHVPMGFGRVRLGRVLDVSAKSLVQFVRGAVEPGSVVHTDGWKGCDDLPNWGYVRKKTVLSSSPEPARVVMPGVHRIAALLKRWLLGAHQGAASARHLDYYLDEYTFRFNRRTSRSRGLLFYRLLEQAVETDPMSYGNMIGGKPLSPQV
jgi:transposase-like protein